MKIIYIAIIATLSLGLTASFTASKEEVKTEVASELTWFTDFQKADAESKKSGKPIFGFFTGSDWCGWCTRLKANVFSKEDFKKWAKEEVVLLELDFPRRKQLPANIKAQNQQLAQVFKVRGYPTVWIFNTTNNDGKVNINAWGSLSYPRATAGQESVKFLSDANRILATQKK